VFPEEESFLLGWLLRLDPELVPAAVRIQTAFSHLDWVTPLRPDFFHVWLTAVAVSPRRSTADDAAGALAKAKRAWAGVRPFDLHIRRINCFHDAVVVETEGEGPRELLARLVEAGISRVRLETFLPHLTLGTFSAAGEPAPLREAIAPLRETVIGSQHVDVATLCLVPASRTTILDPWEVVGSAPLAAT
jgi:2'-5' RNA ligase